MIDILQLTSDEPDIAIADGDSIIREGERSGAVYVLVSGELSVRRHGHPIARITEPGSLVGEMGLLLDEAASADVVAAGAAVVRRMDDAEQCFADNPAFARHVATVLARRLARVVGFLGDLQDQYADRPDTLGLMPEVLRSLLDGVPSTIESGSDREPESPY